MSQKYNLKQLCEIHGGQFFIQYGLDKLQPKAPPRDYWLIFDYSNNQLHDSIKTAVRIDHSWGMSLHLEKDPQYRRTINTFAMTYIIKGCGSFYDPSGQHEVKQGDVILLFPGIPHAYTPSPGERWNEISIFFDGPIFKAWEQPGLLDSTNPIRQLHPVEYWLDRFQQILFPLAGCDIQQTPLQCGRMIELISEMCTSWQNTITDPNAAWLERAQLYLCAMPTLRDANWKSIACELGVSERSLRRKFKNLSGITPGYYHTKHRINKACHRLLESDEKIVKIALELEFANEFHFSRKFKQITGFSPRAYRDFHNNR